VKVDHEVPLRRRRGFDHGDAVGNRRREWLLDQHVLARAQHLDDGLAVQVVGRRDGHRLDVAGRHLVHARRPGAAEPLAGAPSTSLVQIADEGHDAARVGGQRKRVIGSPDARTDDRDSDRCVSHVGCGPENTPHRILLRLESSAVEAGTPS